MKDETKSRQELIDELMEMRRRVAELEALEKERKRAEACPKATAREREKELIGDLRFLSRTAMRFVELSPEEDIYRLIGERLRELVGEAIVVVNSYEEESESFCCRAIEGIGKHARRLARTLGRDPVGMRVRMADDSARAKLPTHELAEVPGGLNELCFGRVPKAVCDAIEKVLGLGEIYAMGFSREGQLLGSAAILMRKGARLGNRNIVETFVNHASIALQRKQAEEALERERDLLRTLMDSSPDHIFFKDRESRFIRTNRAHARFLGLEEPQEAMGKSDFDLFPGENARRFYEEEQRIMESGKAVVAREWQVPSRSGEMVWLSEHKMPMVDERGEVVGVVGISRDVTDLRRARDELSKEKHFSELVIKSLPGVFYVLDEEGEFLRWNENLEKVTGYSCEEIGRMRATDFFRKEDKRSVAEAVQEALVKGETNVRAGLTSKEGQSIPYYFTGRRARIGERECLVGTGMDITEQKRAEEALREREEAERSFAGKLRALQEVTNELSQLVSVDELCRRAVEVGRSRLGFDRLSLWLATDDPGVIRGSFGVDEEGSLRDERTRLVTTTRDSRTERIRRREIPCFYEEDAPLYSDKEEVVGRGWVATAGLWDGEKVIGYLYADNLLVREPLSERQRELLVLYASALGHLCTRKRAEEALREREEAERSFAGRLAALQQVINELSQLHCVDELCRRAVELGRSRLGFDRLSIWFASGDACIVTGTFGVDEKGLLRDERASRLRLVPGSAMPRVLSGEVSSIYREETSLHDGEGRVVGKGVQAMAPLWDGEKAIGCICTDNLLLPRPITERQQELLRLYASALGHLCTRKRAEEALRNSEALYHSLVESLPMSVLRKDLQGRFTFGNRLFCEALKSPLEGIIGKTDYDFFPKELAEKYRGDDVRVAETGELFEDVEEHQQPHGEKIYVQVFKTPVRNFEGETIGTQGMFWDVTERKRMEDALVEERYLLQSLMDKLPDCIYFKDTGSRFTRISRALTERFGLTDPSEALGKTDFEFFTEEHARPAFEDEQEVIRTGKALVAKEEKETWPDGSVTWASTTKMPLRDSEGKIIGTFGVSRDITDRKRAEEELKKTAAELVRSNAELEQFAYVASHDLQEPLRMVASYAQLFAKRYKGHLDSDAEEFIEFIVDGATRMQSLIRDLLAYSRVGTKGKPLEPTDSEAVFERVLTSLEITIEENGAEVTHDGLPRVMADELQLGQLFQNLIGNAIKYHGDELPRVHVWAERSGGEWVFGVRDNGIGIEPEYRDRIFVIFQRLHSRAEYPGTGIGLAICKKIVERHGGRIWVESQPGKGSTFYFTMRNAEVSKYEF